MNSTTIQAATARPITEASTKAVSAAMLVLALSTFLLFCWLLFPLTVDDAYISFRYSDNLAAGHGLTWNVGETPVEGYTNFLWVLIGAGALKLGIPIATFMKVLGVVLGTAAVALMYLITRQISAPEAYAVMPAILLAATPALALWSVAGLETVLFVALLLVSLYFLVREEQAAPTTRSIYLSAPFMTLLALTRPEGIVVSGLLALNLVSSDWMPGHRLALPMTPLIILLAHDPLETVFRAVWSGHWRQRLSSTTIALALVAFAMAPMLYTANLFHRVMATQMDMSIYRWSTEMKSIVDGQYVQVGEWLAENAPANATVVASNVGAIGFLSGLKVIDTIGLTDAAIARNGWTVDDLLAQNPEFIVLESDTAEGFGGLYGTSGEMFAETPAFVENYELVFVLDNGRTDELALFLRHLPHATWLFARRDLGLRGGTP